MTLKNLIKKMKKILLFSLFVFIISCKKDKHVDFDETLINKIANEDFNLPSEYNMLTLFALCNDGNITEIDVQQLRVLHQTKYKNIKFSKFLTKVLNQRLKIESSDDFQCFKLDNKITELYKKNSLDVFIELFCDKSHSKGYVLKKNISSQQRMTIFYYCYINNYLFIFDDVIGSYYLHKTTEL